MIGSIKGNIQSITTSTVIVDVGGIGYIAHISLNTYYSLVDKASVFLYVQSYIREDKFNLYGFETESEKELFNVLLSVQSVGPSLALSIMSGITLAEIIAVVNERDIMRLTKIPGIGKTKAEKILVDLKSKLKKLKVDLGTNCTSSFGSEAIDALLALGYDDKRARLSVNKYLENNERSEIQDIIKGALKLLSQ